MFVYWPQALRNCFAKSLRDQNNNPPAHSKRRASHARAKYFLCECWQKSQLAAVIELFYADIFYANLNVLPV